MSPPIPPASRPIVYPITEIMFFSKDNLSEELGERREAIAHGNESVTPFWAEDSWIVLLVLARPISGLGSVWARQRSPDNTFGPLDLFTAAVSPVK